MEEDNIPTPEDASELEFLEQEAKEKIFIESEDLPINEDVLKQQVAARQLGYGEDELDIIEGTAFKEIMDDMDAKGIHYSDVDIYSYIPESERLTPYLIFMEDVRNRWYTDEFVNYLVKVSASGAFETIGYSDLPFSPAAQIHEHALNISFRRGPNIFNKMLSDVILDVNNPMGGLNPRKMKIKYINNIFPGGSYKATLEEENRRFWEEKGMTPEGEWLPEVAEQGIIRIVDADGNVTYENLKGEPIPPDDPRLEKYKFDDITAKMEAETFNNAEGPEKWKMMRDKDIITEYQYQELLKGNDPFTFDTDTPADGVDDIEQLDFDGPDIRLNPDGSTTEKLPGGSEINRDVPLEEFKTIFSGRPSDYKMPEILDDLKDTDEYRNAQFQLWSMEVEYQDRQKFKNIINRQYEIFYEFIKENPNLSLENKKILLEEIRKRTLMLDEKYRDFTVKKDVDLSLEELTIFDNELDNINTNFKSKLEAALDNLILGQPNDLNRDIRYLQIDELNIRDEYKKYLNEIMNDTNTYISPETIRKLDNVLDTTAGQNAVETMILNMRNDITKHGTYSLHHLMYDYGANNFDVMGAKQDIAQMYWSRIDEIIESYLNPNVPDPDLEMTMQFDFAESKLRELGVSDIKIEDALENNKFFQTNKALTNTNVPDNISELVDTPTNVVDDVIKNKGTINEWFNEAIKEYDLVSGTPTGRKDLLRYSDFEEFLINKKGLKKETAEKIIKDIKTGVVTQIELGPKSTTGISPDFAKATGLTDIGISQNVFRDFGVQNYLDTVYTQTSDLSSSAYNMSFADRQALQNTFYDSLINSDDIVEIYLRQVSSVNVPAENVIFKSQLTQEVPGFYTEPIGGLTPGEMASGGGIKPTENFYKLQINKNNLLIDVPGVNFSNELKIKLDWNLLEKELGINYSQFKDIDNYQLFHTKLSNVANDLGIDNTKLYSTLRKSGYEGTVGYVNRQVEVVLLDPNDDLGIGKKVNFENSNVDDFYNNQSKVNQLDELVIKPDDPTRNQTLRVMEDNPDITNASKRVQQVAIDFAKNNGLAEPNFNAIAYFNPEVGVEAADIYQGLPDFDDSAVPLYNKFIKETNLQYDALNNAGLQFELVDTDPYTPNAAGHQQMINDMQNGRLKVLATSAAGEIPQGSPMAQQSGYVDVNGRPMLNNDVFRAVHDTFGHGMRGNTFGPIGEYNAWLAHKEMYSPTAQRVMTTETLGQNTYVNFGPHMRTEEGALIGKGDTGYIPPQDRPFAPQKVAVMPDTIISKAGDVAIDATGLVNINAMNKVKNFISNAPDAAESLWKATKFTLGKAFTGLRIFDPGDIAIEYGLARLLPRLGLAGIAVPALYAYVFYELAVLGHDVGQALNKAREKQGLGTVAESGGAIFAGLPPFGDGDWKQLGKDTWSEMGEVSDDWSLSWKISEPIINKVFEEYGKMKVAKEEKDYFSNLKTGLAPR